MRMGTRNRPQESSENSRSAERTRAIEILLFLLASTLGVSRPTSREQDRKSVVGHESRG
jgi:hypothetical protein